VENTCDKWGGDTWLAALSSDRPDGGFRFERRLGPAGTNCPHMKRLTNGTFALYLNAMKDGLWPANETKDPRAPVCVGDNVSSPQLMEPALRPCNGGESPMKVGETARAQLTPTLRSTDNNNALHDPFPAGPQLPVLARLGEQLLKLALRRGLRGHDGGAVNGCLAQRTTTPRSADKNDGRRGCLSTGRTGRGG
jgi:hypothetical protein